MKMQTFVRVMRRLVEIAPADGKPSSVDETSARHLWHHAKQPADRRNLFVQAALASAEMWMGGISLR